MTTDAHLRDLERRFLQSGSSGDEAAWLLERVRVGDLTQKRLELAAYCGHVAAGTACRGVAAATGTADAWSLLGRDKECSVRAAYACGELLRDSWRAAHPDDPRADEILRGVQEWLSCPCMAHKREVWRRRDREAIPCEWARVGMMEFHPAGWLPLIESVLLAPGAAGTATALVEIVRVCESSLGDAAVWKAIASALVKWSLASAELPSSCAEHEGV
jgi:hypothetical protein